MQRLLKLGCGASHHPNWVNPDFTPHPPHVLGYDLTHGIPFPDDLFDVVYHSHVLEHFSRAGAVAFLRERLRVLRPGGILRLAVPDLEDVARAYLTAPDEARRGEPGADDRHERTTVELVDQLSRQVGDGEMLAFWRRDPVPAREFIFSRLGAKTRHGMAEARQTPDDPAPARPHPLDVGRFRLSGACHLWMYDSRSLERLLGETGFSQVRLASAGDSATPSLEDNRPNLVLEALACGLPVADFDTGSIPDMVDKEMVRLEAERYPDSGLTALGRDPEYRRKICSPKKEILSRPDRNMSLDDPFFRKRIQGRVAGFRGLLINKHDGAGGAAQIARSLGQALNAGPDEFTYFVERKELSDEWIKVIGPTELDKPAQVKAVRLGLPDYHIASSFFLSKTPEFAAADIIHCHNLHDQYFNPFTAPLFSLSKPMLWTLHDMQALTGNCAHSFACEKYKTGCGACPDLSIFPGLNIDSTDVLWRDKKIAAQVLDAHLAVPSQWLKERVEQSFLRHLPVHVIPNGIDMTIFEPRDRTQVRQALGLPPQATILSFCAHGGISNPFKGGAHLLKALRHLVGSHPHILLLNIGGEYHDPNLPIVNLPFSLDKQVLAMTYAASDLFAYPSLADTFGLVALESLACGTPVVAFRTGALPEIISDGVNGLLVEYANTAQFARALEILVTRPALRKKLAENAPEVRQRFSLQTMVGHYRDRYRTVIEERSRRSASEQRARLGKNANRLRHLASRLEAVGNTIGARFLYDATKADVPAPTPSETRH